eukprot:2561411-Pyramimonas_sp.AAC.1
MSVSDILSEVPDKDRSFFRFLRPTERLALQGLPPSAALHMPSHAVAVKGAGNAFPPPLIMAVMHPMIDALQQSSFDLGSWPHAPRPGCAELPIYDRIERLCMAPLPKKAKAKAKAKAKPKAAVHHKPASSSSSSSQILNSKPAACKRMRVKVEVSFENSDADE